MTTPDPQTLPEKTKDLVQKATDLDLQDIADRVTKIEGQIETGLNQASRELRSRIERVNLGEATVPDAFRNVRKVISPKVHAWLDVAVTGYFLGIGLWFAARGKAGPAAAALENAAMVAGVSIMTDYDGTGEKPIRFKMHGTLDAVQATSAALGPVLHGFADEPEAAFFYGQAANEVAVIATTDWDAGMPQESRETRPKAA